MTMASGAASSKLRNFASLASSSANDWPLRDRSGSTIACTLGKAAICRGASGDQEAPQLRDERVRAARVLGHEAGDGRLEPAALGRVQILDGPHNDGDVATRGHRPEPPDE